MPPEGPGDNAAQPVWASPRPVPMPSGPLAAALAYILWGLFPLYIKQVAQVPALEIVLHRSAWSLLFVFGLLLWLRHFAWLGPKALLLIDAVRGSNTWRPMSRSTAAGISDG